MSMSNFIRTLCPLSEFRIFHVACSRAMSAVEIYPWRATIKGLLVNTKQAELVTNKAENTALWHCIGIHFAFWLVSAHHFHSSSYHQELIFLCHCLALCNCLQLLRYLSSFERDLFPKQLSFLLQFPNGNT